MISMHAPAVSQAIASDAIRQGATRHAVLTLTHKRPTKVVIYQSRSINGLRSIDTDTITVGPRTTVEVYIETGGAWPYLMSARHIVDGRSLRHDLSLIVQPGDRISTSLGDTGFTLDGKSSNYKGQRLYDSLYYARDLSPYDRNSVPFEQSAKKMFATYGKLSDDEMDQFKALYKSGDIDREFLHQAMLDIEYYYALIMTSLVVKNDDQVKTGIINQTQKFSPQVWKKIYARHPINRNSLGATWMPQYSMHYFIFDNKMRGEQKSTRPNFATLEQADMDAQKRYQNSLKKYGQDVEIALAATQLWTWSRFQIFTPFAMDFLSKDHATQFPQSPYNRYLKRFQSDVKLRPQP